MEHNESHSLEIRKWLKMKRELKWTLDVDEMGPQWTRTSNQDTYASVTRDNESQKRRKETKYNTHDSSECAPD